MHVSFRVVFIPRIILIECCVQVQEVGEEASCRHLACVFVKIVVSISWIDRHTTLAFPDLDGEDGCRVVSYTTFRRFEKFANYTTTFRRGVGTVVYRAKHYLIRFCYRQAFYPIFLGFRQVQRTFSPSTLLVRGRALLEMLYSALQFQSLRVTVGCDVTQHPYLGGHIDRFPDNDRIFL